MSTDAPLAPDMHPQAIFANNEMSLSDIEVIGFDYDYTLASYTPLLHRLLFDLGKGVLVNQLKVEMSLILKYFVFFIIFLLFI